MVHWVYVLECEDNYIYVGETKRLYGRFDEHLKSRGGSNTINHKPNRLIGLYKVNQNHSFIRYRNTIKTGQYNRFIIDDWENDGDNLLIENHITQRFLYERRENEWYKIRGGKYTRKTMDETAARYKWVTEKEGRVCVSRNPIDSISVDSIVDRPLCNCNYPSEVKLSKDKSNIYFICALKNIWMDFFSDLQINKPCNFWKPYTEDKDLKAQYEILKIRSREKYNKTCLITDN